MRACVSIGVNIGEGREQAMREALAVHRRYGGNDVLRIAAELVSRDVEFARHVVANPGSRGIDIAKGMLAEGWSCPCVLCCCCHVRCCYVGGLASTLLALHRSPFTELLLRLREYVVGLFGEKLHLLRHTFVKRTTKLV